MSDTKDRSYYNAKIVSLKLKSDRFTEHRPMGLESVDLLFVLVLLTDEASLINLFLSHGYRQWCGCECLGYSISHLQSSLIKYFF